MSVDKISPLLRPAAAAFLWKTDMTAGEIAQRFPSMMSQPAALNTLCWRTRASYGARSTAEMCTMGLKEHALTGTLLHFLAEVCPRSRSFRRDRAATPKKAARRLKA
jgi:ArsR family transcriptional regulator, arsenate/arsenite/antimonite-responsive transcriptional repressor